MLYSDLKAILEQLEGAYRGNTFQSPPSGNPVSKAIYTGNRNVQYYGLDNSVMLEGPRSVVIVIGINYSQKDPSNLTKDLLPKGPPPAVAANWGNERSRLDLCFEYYSGNPKRWVANGLASHPNLLVPDPNTYHLGASNFCGWITECEWTKLGGAFGAGIPWGLLATPPHGRSEPFDHLHALADRLNQSPDSTDILWVGHGLTSEADCLARLFFKKHAIQNWLLVPNLSNWRRGYDEDPSGVIKFGARPDPKIIL